tara:strand:- start:103 stop:492 length:390 start_codon:yes stop_codon:yes gene_type:complete
MTDKDKKYLKISEVAKKLGLVNSKKKEMTHILRFWEKNFKEINPLKLDGNTRYYNHELLEKLKLIKHLLKDKGMTIKGVKLVLKKGIYSLDDYHSFNVKDEYFKKKLIEKTKKILNRIKIIKHGKKNPH